MVRWRKTGFLLVTVSANLASTSFAAEWDKSASLALNSYYTDNVCRAPTDEEGKAIGTVTPGVRLRGNGSRASMALNAAAEFNSLSQSSFTCEGQSGGNAFSNRETWVPRVNFTSQLTAIENLLYLESNAFASQNSINPFAAGGDDNINATGNTNITYRWGAGARIDRRISESWRALLRYNYNEQYNSFDQGIGNSQEDRIELDVGMVPGVSRFSTGVSGQYSEVQFDATSIQPEFTNRLSRVQLWTALQLNQSVQLNALAGQEDNVFLSETDEIDGSYWDAGFVWSPNSRVEVSAGYGERFFGDTPRFNMSYRHKRSTLQASYVRDIQFPRNIRAADGGGDPDDPFDPGLGVPGDPLPGDGNPTFVGQTPVLNEVAALNYRFDGRRTNFRLRFSDSQQTRAQDGRVGDFQSVSAFVSRSIGPKTSVNLSVAWQENEGEIVVDELVEPQNQETVTLGLGLQRRLSKGVSVNFRYTYREQESTNARNEFEENRVDLGLRFTF